MTYVLVYLPTLISSDVQRPRHPDGLFMQGEGVCVGYLERVVCGTVLFSNHVPHAFPLQIQRCYLYGGSMIRKELSTHAPFAPRTNPMVSLGRVYGTESSLTTLHFSPYRSNGIFCATCSCHPSPTWSRPQRFVPRKSCSFDATSPSTPPSSSSTQRSYLPPDLGILALRGWSS